MTSNAVPKPKDLMLDVIRAVDDAGGSASARQIREKVNEAVDPFGKWASVTLASSGMLKLEHHAGWATMYCKYGGLLEQPSRGLYVFTKQGATCASLPDKEAGKVVDAAFERAYEQQRKKNKSSNARTSESDDSITDRWKTSMLASLHGLTPTGFERYVLLLLRLYGMELEHTGGTGDGGIDGLGIAPFGDVLSTTVAMQAKRYDPTSSVPRSEVALFQHDASGCGAERAIFVTLAKFTRGAREAARKDTPTVELIDGERLCDLIADKGEEAGVIVSFEMDQTFLDNYKKP